MYPRGKFAQSVSDRLGTSLHIVATIGEIGLLPDDHEQPRRLDWQNTDSLIPGISSQGSSVSPQFI